MQRHATFVIDLRACDLSTAESTCDTHLDALRAEPHCVLNNPTHRTAELHAALELLCDVLRDEQCINFRLADLFDVDVHRHVHHPREFAAQPLDVFTFLANDDTGPRGVN